MSSTGALSLPKVPKRLLVIGAGVIGLELGSVWRRLGAQVTVVEYLDRILPGTDGEVARQLQRILEKQGIAFKLGHKVTGVDKKGGAQSVTIEPSKGGEAEKLETDVVLVAIGRVPFTEGLGPGGSRREARQPRTRRRRRALSDRASRASTPSAMSSTGRCWRTRPRTRASRVAEILAGQAGHVNYGVIPNVVYTAPELASVGKSEEELKAAGVAYKVGKFPFTANGRAKANHVTDGFVKILADAATDRVLGVHILGANASEMIAEPAVLMEFGGSAEDLARTCHAHPTLTEAVKEAALAVDKRALHM